MSGEVVLGLGVGGRLLCTLYRVWEVGKRRREESRVSGWPVCGGDGWDGMDGVTLRLDCEDEDGQADWLALTIIRVFGLGFGFGFGNCIRI
ncbi:predicted protein [Sclerotinia sclerotiorum 1980 UF-70]|uniref:Uncharacterized protein n=1 Tax=Sclerotinia sclerotiorum (strain ATCC 18683 / 1980 / Ss-1) TaxID=665079 RepID=A7EEZ2_SCLS1|nr:predicted protein [Sclerotinia sclerotiorum 1980 UF-70]EDO01408.1 predicted protein [Sclerotinia sclerotiorum 1980 UF-70]